MSTTTVVTFYDPETLPNAMSSTKDKLTNKYLNNLASSIYQSLKIAECNCFNLQSGQLRTNLS